MSASVACEFLSDMPILKIIVVISIRIYIQFDGHLLYSVIVWHLICTSKPKFYKISKFYPSGKMIKGSAGQEKLTSAFWLSNVTNRQMNLGGSVEGSFSTSPVLTFLKLISFLLNFHKKAIVLETFKFVPFFKILHPLFGASHIQWRHHEYN